jgi:phosphoribosylaminoimidazole-succinocarboxamide synthase
MAQKLDEPVFTPAYKNDNGHDENISFDRMSDICGKELADKLRAISMEIYKRAAEMTLEKGIIIADTKFEFGLYEGEVILIDEVLTPDSSRFWPVESYEVGKSPFSYDKQFIRDYLESSGWDKNPPAPLLPDNIINKTLDKYIEAYSVIESLKTD